MRGSRSPASPRETDRIRLGTMVTSATFRLPGLLAIQVAQVDDMSGGRAELGLGAGWFDAEHTAHGVPFQPLAERFERLEEQLTILTGFWEVPVGETFDFDGRHYQLKDSPGLPKPVQQPHPPLIVGGGGPKRTPRLAATFADEFNLPFSSLADTDAQFARVRAACMDKDRDPATLRLSAAQTVCCGANDAEVERRAAKIGRKADELRGQRCGRHAGRGGGAAPGVRRHRRRVRLSPGARPRGPGPHRVARRGSAPPSLLTRGSARSGLPAGRPDWPAGLLGTLAAGRGGEFRVRSGISERRNGKVTDMTITSRGAVAPTSDQSEPGNAASAAGAAPLDTPR